MRILEIAILLAAAVAIDGSIGQRHKFQLKRKQLGSPRRCVSKFYNRELGPLEILMLPLGEKLWLRAWFGLHISNLLDMHGVDVAEMTQLVVPEHNRTRRSTNQGLNTTYRIRLPRHVVPSSYRLELRPYLANVHFQGRVRINVTCLESTDRIVLHAHEELRVSIPRMSVKRMKGRDSTVRSTFKQLNQTHHARFHSVTEDFVKISKIIRGSQKSWYEIVLTDNIVKGAIYELDILFSGNFNNYSREAFYVGSYREDSSTRLFIATQMKQGNARRVFPCFDEPGFKATFEISVARSSDMTVVSTMPLQDTELVDKESFWKWDRFQVTPPMSTSSLVIFIFNSSSLLQVLPTETEYPNVRGFARASDSFLVQAAIDHLVVGVRYMERYLGVPFPLPQLNVVFLPNISSSEEDYWGFFMVRNQLQSASLFHVLRQWFGHLVTAEWWLDDSLTTSLAQYHAYICPLEVIQGCELDNTPTWGPRYSYTSQHGSNEIINFKQIQQHKMIWFLRMLNFTMTEKTFRRGIQIFLENRAYNTFIPNDLWDALDMEAWEDNTLDLSVSIRQVARSWLAKDQFPIITVTRNYSTNTADVEQHAFMKKWSNAVSSQEQPLWWVPILYLSQEDINTINISMVTWMQEERRITIQNLPGSDSFIFMNFEEIGLFIVTYDTTNWNLLAQYLMMSASGSGQTLLPLEARSKLLHDAWLLALGSKLDFATALNMTLFMKYERDYSMWLNFHSMCITFIKELAKTDAEWKFELYIRQLFTPMYESLGEATDSEDTSKTSFHVIANAIMHRMGYERFVDENSAEFNRWLHAERSVSANVYIDFCAVFRWGYAEDWERGRLKLIQMLGEKKELSKQTQLLEALISCSRDPHNVERILKMLLLEDYEFSNQDIKQAFDAVSGFTAFLNFVSRNWNVVKQRFANEPIMWNYLIQKVTESFKTQDGYNLVYELYIVHQHEFGGASHIIKQSLASIRENMMGLYKHLPEIESWLDQHLSNFSVPVKSSIDKQIISMQSN